MKIWLLVAAAILLAAAVPARLLADPTQADLAAVTERGRMLFAYDQNAAIATDAVAGAHATFSAGSKYVGHVEPDGTWIFDFGTLGPDGDFLVEYETIRAPGATTIDTKTFKAPQPMPGFVQNAAHAIDLAARELVVSSYGKYRYNYAVLPAPDGKFYVYYYPAQNDAHVYAFGGDERFLVSADGSAIVETHRMHKSVMTFNAARMSRDGGEVVAATHNDLFGDVPEDSDVMLVLARRPPIAEYVGAGGRLFRINLDGSIEDKGPVKKPQG